MAEILDDNNLEGTFSFKDVAIFLVKIIGSILILRFLYRFFVEDLFLLRIDYLVIFPLLYGVLISFWIVSTNVYKGLEDVLVISPLSKETDTDFEKKLLLVVARFVLFCVGSVFIGLFFFIIHVIILFSMKFFYDFDGFGNFTIQQFHYSAEFIIVLVDFIIVSVIISIKIGFLIKK